MHCAEAMGKFVAALEEHPVLSGFAYVEHHSKEDWRRDYAIVPLSLIEAPFPYLDYGAILADVTDLLLNSVSRRRSARPVIYQPSKKFPAPKFGNVLLIHQLGRGSFRYELELIAQPKHADAYIEPKVTSSRRKPRP